MSPTTMATILIVEDDPKQLRLYSKALRGHRLNCVASATAALKALAEARPDLILLDQVLGAGERGLDFLPQLAAMAGPVPIVVISGSLHLRQQLHVLPGLPVQPYLLDKPVDLDELELTVKTALAGSRGGRSERA